MGISSFQEKKKIRKIFFSTPIIVIFLILICWMLFRAWGVASVWVEISKKNEKLIQKIEEIKNTRISLEDRIKSLESEYGIDLEARARFNLRKPGEEVAIFLEEETKNGKEEKNNFICAIGGFFGRFFAWCH